MVDNVSPVQWNWHLAAAGLTADRILPSHDARNSNAVHTLALLVFCYQRTPFSLRSGHGLPIPLSLSFTFYRSFGRHVIVSRYHLSFPLVVVFDMLIVVVRSFKRLGGFFGFLPFHERYRPRLLS